jgi:hypothetical protein
MENWLCALHFGHQYASGFGLQWLISGRFFMGETKALQAYDRSAVDVVVIWSFPMAGIYLPEFFNMRRNPRVLFFVSHPIFLRMEARKASVSELQSPPRATQLLPPVGPQGSLPLLGELE